MDKNFDGKVLIVKDYLTMEECQELKNWAMNNKESQFVDGISRNESGEVIRIKTRVTNRISDNISYPNLVYDIQKKIREDFSLLNNEVVEGHGKNDC